MDGPSDRLLISHYENNYGGADVFTGALLVLTMAILMLRNVGPVPLVFGGAVIGLLRKAIPWEQVAKLAR